MTKAEAAMLLEQLLNGVDPLTGEVLPEGHVCVQPTVIRALHAGYAALMKETESSQGKSSRADCIPASRENTHKPWTDEEDEYLYTAWKDNVLVDDMRRHLRRTLRGVKCRLVYLGIADYSILERKYQPPKGCEHSGLPWYPEEEEAAKALYLAGVSPADIARQLKRTLRAIVLHMFQMGLITETQREALLLGQEGGTPS